MVEWLTGNFFRCHDPKELVIAVLPEFEDYLAGFRRPLKTPTRILEFLPERPNCGLGDIEYEGEAMVDRHRDAYNDLLSSRVDFLNKMGNFGYQCDYDDYHKCYFPQFNYVTLEYGFFPASLDIRPIGINGSLSRPTDKLSDLEQANLLSRDYLVLRINAPHEFEWKIYRKYRKIRAEKLAKGGLLSIVSGKSDQGSLSLEKDEGGLSLEE